jgi:hypothetical protein
MPMAAAVVITAAAPVNTRMPVTASPADVIP